MPEVRVMHKKIGDTLVAIDQATGEYLSLREAWQGKDGIQWLDALEGDQLKGLIVERLKREDPGFKLGIYPGQEYGVEEIITAVNDDSPLGITFSAMEKLFVADIREKLSSEGWRLAD